MKSESLKELSKFCYLWRRRIEDFVVNLQTLDNLVGDLFGYWIVTQKRQLCFALRINKNCQFRRFSRNPAYPMAKKAKTDEIWVTHISEISESSPKLRGTNFRANTLIIFIIFELKNNIHREIFIITRTMYFSTAFWRYYSILKLLWFHSM